MRKEFYLLIFGIVLIFISCSSVKLMDSWKSQSFDTLSNSKIMVVSRASDLQIRKSYETAIATKLRKQNLDVIESHLLFPELKEANTSQEAAQVVKMFKDSGISGIILTSLKQTIETQNRKMASQSSIPKNYKDKASFTSNPGNTNVPISSTSKTYVLEALTYNLTLAQNKQLVNVCLVDITDPDTANKIQKSFTKIIADQFK